MRLAQHWIGLAGFALATPLALAPAAAAPETPAHNAWLDPAAPSRPLPHQPLAHSGELVQQPTDWAAANAAVAQFPRGHADVLRWEAAQATGQPAPGGRQ